MKYAFIVGAAWVTLVGCKSKDAARPEVDPAQVTAAPSSAPTTSPAAAIDAANLIIALPSDEAARVAFAGDMVNICRVAELSGADNAPPGERGVHTAVWLGSNVHSEDGRKFLGALAPLTGMAKADALDNMARALGIDACPLSAEWRK